MKIDCTGLLATIKLLSLFAGLPRSSIMKLIAHAKPTAVTVDKKTRLKKLILLKNMEIIALKDHGADNYVYEFSAQAVGMSRRMPPVSEIRAGREYSVVAVLFCLDGEVIFVSQDKVRNQIIADYPLLPCRATLSRIIDSTIPAFWHLTETGSQQIWRGHACTLALGPSSKSGLMQTLIDYESGRDEAKLALHGP